MGQVEAIHVALSAGTPMQSLSEVEALPGVGLAGDRYSAGVGFYSDRPTDPGAREVTLIEAEVLEQLSIEHGIALDVSEHRRNLTTRGVRLDGLLGRRFRVGEVVLEGVKDCPPCEHLVQLVGKPVLQPLVNRGGLRARIVEGGTIRVGDAIVQGTTAPELRTRLTKMALGSGGRRRRGPGLRRWRARAAAGRLIRAAPGPLRG